MSEKNTLMLGTRKGLVTLKRHGQGWKHHSVSFLGIPVSLTYVDPRTDTWWACLDHGHWGQKLHFSMDQGSTWEEVESPKFPEGAEMKPGVPAVVRYLWAFAEGGADNDSLIYVGTEPGGLFKSQDQGKTFELVSSLWDQPSRPDNWFGGGRDYAGIHSIVVDPRDSNHIYVGISVAGVFETTDGGETWEVRNKGLRADFLPDPQAEVGHDPHLLVACPESPDHLWQQNHCGIFRSVNGGKDWQDVTQEDGPARFGFAVAVDRQDPEQAWVVPAVSDEVRVAVDGALCVCRTDDGGVTWKDLRQGLPQQDCYDIVFRHALSNTGDTLAFGTTTGNLFVSNNKGDNWETISSTLPMIYSVDFL
ncbi:MAG: glycoside hydrolase [Cyclobacteriaceae bacterium]|nr:glycoside hydrolase [Cyclobacteriaceae bacterium]